MVILLLLMIRGLFAVMVCGGRFAWWFLMAYSLYFVVPVCGGGSSVVDSCFTYDCNHCV